MLILLDIASGMSWWVRGWASYCEACFFFSSRRRHTRFDCDWSSDVCSSDLHTAPLPVRGRDGGCPRSGVPGDTGIPRRVPDRLAVCGIGSEQLGESALANVTSDRKSVV